MKEDSNTMKKSDNVKELADLLELDCEFNDLPYLDTPPENYIVNKEECTMVGRPSREYKLNCTCKECKKDFEMIRTFKPDMRQKPKARFRYVYNISTCPHCGCQLHINK
jgi:hypothetical protein